MDLNPSKTNWTPRNFCDLTRLNNFVRKAKMDVRCGVEITYKDFLHGDVRKKGKKLMNYKLIELPVHGDKRGKLVAIENLKQIPFEIKRVLLHV